MEKTVTCRHCQRQFSPSRTKRGFIDECPSCLVERSMPLVTKSKLELYLAGKGYSSEEIRTKVAEQHRRLRRLFRSWGWSEARINAGIAEEDDNPTVDF